MNGDIIKSKKRGIITTDGTENNNTEWLNSVEITQYLLSTENGDGKTQILDSTTMIMVYLLICVSSIYFCFNLIYIDLLYLCECTNICIEHEFFPKKTYAIKRILYTYASNANKEMYN